MHIIKPTHTNKNVIFLSQREEEENLSSQILATKMSSFSERDREKRD
jgi:hypothetical protein